MNLDRKLEVCSRTAFRVGKHTSHNFKMEIDMTNFSRAQVQSSIPIDLNLHMF